MRKVAVYCGTKNLYNDMFIAAKSLMVHSSVDKIYFLIEDDKFPYLLPNIIECINVKNQTYFPSTGKNYKNKWTYMVLMRAALSKVLPNEDIVLSLDADTIIEENIDELWKIDLSNKYLAAVREPKKSTGTFLYINFGVTLLNLKALRESKKDEKIIYCLNTYKYSANEQDCFCNNCQGKIYELPSMYNVNNFTKPTDVKKIIHFAASNDWRDNDIVKKYRFMPLKTVIKKWESNHNLTSV